MTKNIFFIGLFVLAAALAVQALWLKHVFTDTQSEFSERVRLALRQTAEELFRKTGDSTSIVPPVSQTADNAWLVRFDHNFDYECLPPLLTRALKDQAIEGNYEVGIYDCWDDALILGYAGSTNDGTAIAACDPERDPFGCFYLTLLFTDRYVVPLQEVPVGALIIGAIVLAFLVTAFVIYRRKKRAALAPFVSGDEILQFGRSELNALRLTIRVNGNAKTLTYREARLLHFMASHPNQLLSREQLVEVVLEKETRPGDRGLDVLVSRLRKLLQEDDLVKITNVHKLGYRLEVLEP